RGQERRAAAMSSTAAYPVPRSCQHGEISHARRMTRPSPISGPCDSMASCASDHVSCLPHLGKHLCGQHVQFIENEALWHAGPLHAHDEVIDARAAVTREHLLR